MRSPQAGVGDVDTRQNEPVGRRPQFAFVSGAGPARLIAPPTNAQEATTMGGCSQCVRFPAVLLICVLLAGFRRWWSPLT